MKKQLAFIFLFLVTPVLNADWQDCLSLVAIYCIKKAQSIIFVEDGPEELPQRRHSNIPGKWVKFRKKRSDYGKERNNFFTEPRFKNETQNTQR